ncbi:hypothetical protein HO133_001836 [Letharia lupina]|uniref:Uncharacterized protein n=1 Tax=Letharia lupina TaxID=560253 RepID=A0A8H6FBL1_9LECA|nr:uncharacterized protein HO133_001836 [Letharia lupina]KAF6221868.1 hypothetical protein HO133_001836 [Letharia lupina]
MSDLKIVIPKCGKLEPGFNIYRFTSDLLNANSSRRLPPTRQEVNFHWAGRVMQAYPSSDDPMRIFLLEQMSCPLVEKLWEKRADEEAFRLKRAKQMESGFHHIDRNLTNHERKEHPFAVILTHAVHGDVIVPDIVLRPLHRVSFLHLVRKILAANPTKTLDLFVLYDLWDAILTKVYDYEYDWREDKKHEGRTASYHEYIDIVSDTAQSKKRKHSQVEEDSDDSDAPLAKTKQAKSSAKAAKAPETSGSSNATSSTTKAKKPAKTYKAGKGSGSLDVPSSTTEVFIPTIVSQAEGSGRRTAGIALAASANRAPVRDTAPRPSTVPLQSILGPSTRVSNSATPIPPPTRPANAAPARAPTTGSDSAQSSSRHAARPPTTPQASDMYQLSSHEAGLLSRGISPWPYDPRTGEKTGSTAEYGLSDRDYRLQRNGIPPWPYDPRTGAKQKFTTGYRNMPG